MILSGKEIKKRIYKGDIVIDPFEEFQLNPNSYDLTLANELLVYSSNKEYLDMADVNPYKILEIPESGLVLKPGTLYLGKTKEWTETKNLVPMLEGRSSVGRLGISIHATAGFGDVGYRGCWTLEISCVEPVKIYPNVPICQIFYHTIEGEIETTYNGKYQNSSDMSPSKMFMDFCCCREKTYIL